MRQIVFWIHIRPIHMLSQKVFFENFVQPFFTMLIYCQRKRYGSEKSLSSSEFHLKLNQLEHNHCGECIYVWLKSKLQLHGCDPNHTLAKNQWTQVEIFVTLKDMTIYLYV